MLGGDLRSDSPGLSTKHCTYTLLDVQSQEVGLQGDKLHPSLSRISMEVKDFKEALETTEENGVKVSTISTDRHPQLREN